jgi:hypothetical protein
MCTGCRPEHERNDEAGAEPKPDCRPRARSALIATLVATALLLAFASTLVLVRKKNNESDPAQARSKRTGGQLGATSAAPAESLESNAPSAPSHHAKKPLETPTPLVSLAPSSSLDRPIRNSTQPVSTGCRRT